MTPEEFARKMMACFPSGDYDKEIAHAEADALMCRALIDLGYADGIAIFDAADKWYA